MALDYKKSLDKVGWKLLLALQRDGRLTFAELGRHVHLSLPSVSERVKRLEEAGIITGYQARVEPSKLDLPLVAFIHLKTSTTRYPELIELAQQLPEVRECHHITGDDAFIIKVFASTIQHLEVLIGKLSLFGATKTSIVMSSPVNKHVLEPTEHVDL